MRSTPCCHGGKVRLKAARNRSVASLELRGRRAGVGNAELHHIAHGDRAAGGKGDEGVLKQDDFVARVIQEIATRALPEKRPAAPTGGKPTQA